MLVGRSRTTSSTRRATTPRAPTPSATRSIDALGARATGTVRVGISREPRRARATPSRTTTRSRCARAHASRCRCSPTTPTPTAARSPCTSAEPNDAETTAEVVDERDRARSRRPTTPGQLRGRSTRSRTSSGGTSSGLRHRRRSTPTPRSPIRWRATPCSPSATCSTATPSTSTCSHNVFFADGEVARARRRARRRATASTAEVLPEQAHPGDDRPSAARSSRSRSSHPDDDAVRVATPSSGCPATDDALPAARPHGAAAPGRQRGHADDRPQRLRGRARRQAGAAHRHRARCAPPTPTATTLVVDERHPRVHLGRPVLRPRVDHLRGHRRHVGDDPERPRPPSCRCRSTCTPRENQPPVFSGGVVDFEPGQEKELDLVRLTNYPYDDDVDELAYAVLDAAARRASRYELNGQRLDARAPTTTAVKGTDARRSPVGAATTLNEGTPGASSCRSCRRRARSRKPAPDTAVAQRGETTVDRRARQRRGQQPVPRDAAAGRRRSAGSTARALPDGRHRHAERGQLAADASRSPSRRRAGRHQPAVPGRRRDRRSRPLRVGQRARSRCRTCPIR